MYAFAPKPKATQHTPSPRSIPTGQSNFFGQSQRPSLKPLPFIQAKLTVSSPGDTYEQEADRVADQVMATPSHPDVSSSPPRIQRLSGQSKGKMAAPASVGRVLASPGRSLEPALRQDMEQRFGHDFSRVRVHTSEAAKQSAQDMSAHAYTVGRNMVFGAGRFAPGTHEGRRLIAHELAHVLQQGEASPTIQRQPAKPQEKSKFDFMLANVEGKLRVMAIYSPSDPADFLDAFEEKGNQLIVAEYAWLSNNLIRFIEDSVVKEKRNPFANIDVDTLRDVAGRGYDKAIAGLAVKGASEAGEALLKIVWLSKKVVPKVQAFGGVLAWVGSALIQALIGPLFDKSKELVKQAAAQFREAMQTVNTETIIPKVNASTAQFTKFMASLKEYLLQNEGDPEPKTKSKAKSVSTGVVIGEGDYKMTVSINKSSEFTESRRDKILLDLANVVLDIDDVIPKLKSDVSMYKELAVKAGVFSGKTAPASQLGPPKDFTPTHSEEFRVSRQLVGKTRFPVSQGAKVIIESEAQYDTDVDIEEMNKDVRPPNKYTIDLYRVNTSWRKGDRKVGTTMEYEVGKTASAEWSAPDNGEYYLVISKGGNPNFVLEGNVRVEVRP